MAFLYLINFLKNNAMSDDNHQNSGFLFGLILGAIVAALVGIIIYQNKDTRVYHEFKKRLSQYIDDFIGKKTALPIKKKKIKKKPSAVPKKFLVKA